MPQHLWCKCDCSHSMRQTQATSAGRCWRVLGGAPRCCCVKHVPEPHTEVLLSLVGRMSAVLPILKYRARTSTTGNRHVQARRGAPGLDRTADTRFRKHEEGVTGC